jgi:hypothetical protein
MLATFRRKIVKDGAATAIISGNRAPHFMLRPSVRHAGMDGRLEDLGTGVPANFMPVISDNCTEQFASTGQGPISDGERRSPPLGGTGAGARDRTPPP